MANEPVMTLIGNLTADPELRFTQAGTAVANSVAGTPRSFDKWTGEWKDGQALFMRCTIWRDAAENVAESLLMLVLKRRQPVDLQLSDVDMSLMSKGA